MKLQVLLLVISTSYTIKLQITIANSCIMKLLLIDLLVVRLQYYSGSVNDVHLRIITFKLTARNVPRHFYKWRG